MMAQNLASILLDLELNDLSNFTLVPQGIMKATASSNQNGEEPSKAIDGDTSTMFHTDWNNTTMPHWLDIEFATPQTIDQILYTQDPAVETVTR
ncbi:discoidin domain-containing protein [Allobaculum mucilyticum]|nr:discoidin domain-containing protein [Allobaculum mucilyticum]